MKFEGTSNYISTDDLNIAVNASITLEKPLLIKGEPGTGKTELARQISESLGLSIIEWNIKSTTKSQQGLYEYDAVSRLRDSQLGDKKIEDIGKKLDSQESKLSHVADNVADLTKVITKLKESLIPTNKCELNVDVIRQKTNRVGVNLLGPNNKEDINCVEISNNGDSMMLSSDGEKLIQNISDIKSILIELDKNMKINKNK